MSPPQTIAGAPVVPLPVVAVASLVPVPVSWTLVLSATLPPPVFSSQSHSQLACEPMVSAVHPAPHSSHWIGAPPPVSWVALESVTAVLLLVVLVDGSVAAEAVVSAVDWPSVAPLSVGQAASRSTRQGTR